MGSAKGAKGVSAYSNIQTKVSMFGGLSITVGDTVIKDTASKSYQMWHLLEYLITFRHKTISQDELIEALWEEDDIENPASALKNLVYRTRSIFAANNVPFAKKMITYSKGSYQWNNHLNCVVDIEQFEELYKKAANITQPLDFRIEKYMAAIDLYKGDLLPASSYKNWVMPVSSYYRSLYFKCVYEVLSLLNEQETFHEMEMICNRALMVDQFDENVHKYLLLALIRQGQQSKAISHYKFVTDLFLHELGVNPSVSMRNIYRQILKTTHTVEIDIGIIKQDLKETDAMDGAFYCEYEVFKNIYQVQVRTASRTEQPIFVCLITLADSQGSIPDGDLRKKAMDGLFKVIQTSTRKYDVFARFSATQYVLLLPTSNFENCNNVLKRIVKQYKQTYRVKSVDINYTIQPLDMVTSTV